MKNLILFLSILFSNLAFGQTTIAYQIKGKSVEIDFKYLNSLNDLRNLQMSYPLYVVDSVNYIKIAKSAELIKILDKERAVLKSNSVTSRELRDEYEIILKEQEERVENYKQSYGQMVSVNKELSSQLDEAIRTGKEAARKNLFKTTMYGTLSGIIVGLIIGIAISN